MKRRTTLVPTSTATPPDRLLRPMVEDFVADDETPPPVSPPCGWPADLHLAAVQALADARMTDELDAWCDEHPGADPFASLDVHERRLHELHLTCAWRDYAAWATA